MRSEGYCRGEQLRICSLVFHCMYMTVAVLRDYVCMITQSMGNFQNCPLSQLGELTKFYVDGNQTAATLIFLSLAFAQFLGLFLYRVYCTLKTVYTQYYQLTFLNNEAGLGGNELYGGGLQYACNQKCKLLTQGVKVIHVFMNF